MPEIIEKCEEDNDISYKYKIRIRKASEPFHFSPQFCPMNNCKFKLLDRVKTGFKKGKNMQWKAYCLRHGYIYYDLRKK